MELLEAHGVCSAEDLVKVIGPAEYDSKVLKPNLEEGHRFANKIRCSGRQQVIFTGPLYHPSWRFADYMKVCLSVLRTRCHSVFFSNDWEYSQGAIMELVAALESGLRVYTSDLSLMELGAAAGSLKNARAEVSRIRYDSSAWDYAIACLAARARFHSSRLQAN